MPIPLKNINSCMESTTLKSAQLLKENQVEHNVLSKSNSSLYNSMTSPLTSLRQISQKNKFKKNVEKDFMSKIQYYKQQQQNYGNDKNGRTGSINTVNNSTKPATSSAENYPMLKASSVIYKIPQFCSPEISSQISDSIRRKVDQIRKDIVTHFPQISPSQINTPSTIKSSNYNPKKLHNQFNHRSDILDLQEWLKESLKNPPKSVDDLIEYKNMIMGIGMRDLIRLINKRCLEEGRMVQDVWEMTWTICKEIILYLSKRARNCENILEQELLAVGKEQAFESGNLGALNSQQRKLITQLQDSNSALKKELQQLSIQYQKILKQNRLTNQNANEFNTEYLKVLEQNLALYLHVGQKSKHEWVRKMYFHVSKARSSMRQMMQTQIKNAVLTRIRQQKIYQDNAEEGVARKKGKNNGKSKEKNEGESDGQSKDQIQGESEDNENIQIDQEGKFITQIGESLINANSHRSNVNGSQSNLQNANSNSDGPHQNLQQYQGDQECLHLLQQLQKEFQTKQIETMTDRIETSETEVQCADEKAFEDCHTDTQELQKELQKLGVRIGKENSIEQVEVQTQLLMGCIKQIKAGGVVGKKNGVGNIGNSKAGGKKLLTPKAHSRRDSSNTINSNIGNPTLNQSPAAANSKVKQSASKSSLKTTKSALKNKLNSSKKIITSNNTPIANENDNGKGNGNENENEDSSRISLQTKNFNAIKQQLSKGSTLMTKSQAQVEEEEDVDGNILKGSQPQVFVCKECKSSKKLIKSTRKIEGDQKGNTFNGMQKQKMLQQRNSQQGKDVGMGIEQATTSPSSLDRTLSTKINPKNNMGLQSQIDQRQSSFDGKVQGTKGVKGTKDNDYNQQSNSQNHYLRQKSFSVDQKDCNLGFGIGSSKNIKKNMSLNPNSFYNELSGQDEDAEHNQYDRQKSTLIYDINYKREIQSRHKKQSEEQSSQLQSEKSLKWLPNENTQIWDRHHSRSPLNSYITSSTSLPISTKKPYFKFFTQHLCFINQEYINKVSFSNPVSDNALDGYFNIVQEINEMPQNKIQMSDKQMHFMIERNLLPIVQDLLNIVKKSVVKNNVEKTLKGFNSLPYMLMKKFSTKYGVKMLAIKNVKFLLCSLKKIQTITDRHKLLRLMLFTDCRASFSEDLFVYLLISSVINPYNDPQKLVDYEEIAQIREICFKYLTTQKEVYEEFENLASQHLGQTSKSIESQKQLTIKLAPLLRSIVTNYRMSKINKLEQMGFVFLFLKKENTVEYQTFAYFITCLKIQTEVKIKIVRNFLENCDQKNKKKKMIMSESAYSRFLIRCPQFNLRILKSAIAQHKKKLKKMNNYFSPKGTSKNIKSEKKSQVSFGPQVNLITSKIQQDRQSSSISKAQAEVKVLTNTQNASKPNQQTEKELCHLSQSKQKVQFSMDKGQKNEVVKRREKRSPSIDSNKVRKGKRIAKRIRQYSFFTFTISKFLENSQENQLLSVSQRNFIEDYLEVHVMHCEVQELMGVVDYFSSEMLEIICWDEKDMKVSI